MIATVMLLAAVLVSLALGVLVAYGICYGMLRMFHIHRKAATRGGVKASAVGFVTEP